MNWVPEGDWQEYDGGAIRYLRGQSSGAYEIRLDGSKPGQTVRVYPGEDMSNKKQRQIVVAAMRHAQETTRIRRLNSDDKAAWLIGTLWSKGVREVEFHVDLAHRLE